MSDDTIPHVHEDGVEHTHDEAPKPLSGFAVLISPDGGVFIERNPSILSVEVQREASLVEVRRACSDIVMDLQAQTAAEYTVLRLNALNTPREEVAPQA
jgi:hypothetical protein